LPISAFLLGVHSNAWRFLRLKLHWGLETEDGKSLAKEVQSLTLSSAVYCVLYVGIPTALLLSVGVVVGVHTVVHTVHPPPPHLDRAARGAKISTYPHTTTTHALQVLHSLRWDTTKQI